MRDFQALPVHLLRGPLSQLHTRGEAEALSIPPMVPAPGIISWRF